MNLIHHPTDKKIIELCQQGKIAEAIKFYKEDSGAGLKESKEYVDQLIDKYGISVPKNKGACFVATACYGNYNAPEVKVLQKFRDEKLLTTFPGRFFVKIYYTISPPIAKMISRSNVMKLLVRRHILEPIISIINRRY